MALKPPDILNRLPSVSELLEKPQIRALVDRWNRSVVAGNVRSFLEELRNDFERRAAALPSIRELAERAARYVVSRQHQSLGIAINATGEICGPLWSSAPLAETALEHMIALGREYGTSASVDETVSHGELNAAVCRLTGAAAARVVHSYQGATCLALAALATGREVIVGAESTGDGWLSKFAASTSTTLIHVVGSTVSSGEDYGAFFSPATAAVLEIRDDDHSNIRAASATLQSRVALARERNVPFIDALGAAPIVSPPASIAFPGRTAAESIAAGADLVILRGDAFVGGPACGILLGREDVIRRISEHSLLVSLEIDPLRAAALAATLACYENQSDKTPAIPVWQCLSASIDNLRNRAERLAAQLGHGEGVATAAAIETRSRILPNFAGEGWPSYGVSLTATGESIRVLNERLQASKIPICGRLEADQIVLDLRTVLPRQDRLIVDSLLGPPSADTPQPAANSSESPPSEPLV
jgi:L-seryl-tRNA(Ser) seleniumtransferase